MKKINPSWYYIALLLAIVGLLVMSSCSVTKHVNKKENTEQKKTETQTELTSSTKSTKTITEAFDKNQVIPGDSSKSTGKADVLKPVIIEMPAVSNTLTIDAVGNYTLNTIVKPKKFTATGARTITEVTDSNLKLDQHVKTDEKKKEFEKQVDKKREAPINFNYLWWLLLLLLIPIWKYRKVLFG